MTAKAKKPRRGRPPLPESERGVMVSTRVPGWVRDYLVRIGDGKLTRGLAAVAIRAAAESEQKHDSEKM